MSNTDILTLTPEFGITEGINFATFVSETESGIEHRAALWDVGLRDYNVKVRYLSKADMDNLWQFYIDRLGSYDHFLLKILHEFEATAENIGNADNINDSFLLHRFPVDTSDDHSCTVDGSIETLYTLSNNFVTEKSYITFDSVPSNGEILVTYEFYYKVRFAEDKLTRDLAAYQLLHAGLKFREVRWNTFSPPNGNSSSSSSSSSG